MRQDSFEELERTLVALEREYSAAVIAGEHERARACRRAVIEAKDHARLVGRNPRTEPVKAAQKEEMMLWMLTWLENPAVFPAWLALRKAAVDHAEAGSASSLLRSTK